MRSLMGKPRIAHSNLQRWAVALWLLGMAVMLTAASTVPGQNNAAKVTRFRTSYLAELGVPKAVGLSLSPLARIFLVIEANGELPQGDGHSKLQLITQFDGLVDSVPVAVPVTDPINLTFDSEMDRWFLLDSETGMIIEIRSESHGRPDPVTMKRYRIQGLEIQEPAA